MKQCGLLVAVAVVCLHALEGCYHQNGIRVHEGRWDAAVAALGAQAEIEMRCGDLEYRLIERIGKEPSKIAVEGCGQRALYERPVRRGMFRKRGTSDWAVIARD